MPTLAEATIAYQAQLELLRSAENGLMNEEFLEDLREDLEKARSELEVAWMNQIPSQTYWWEGLAIANVDSDGVWVIRLGDHHPWLLKNTQGALP